jgi:hypothetical protein
MLFSNCYVDFINIFTGTISYTISQPDTKKKFQDSTTRFSRTFSRTIPVFQDFPGPGKNRKKIPGLSRNFQDPWEP